jgi:hypothetical protein
VAAGSSYVRNGLNSRKELKANHSLVRFVFKRRMCECPTKLYEMQTVEDYPRDLAKWGYATGCRNDSQLPRASSALPTVEPWTNLARLDSPSSSASLGGIDVMGEPDTATEYEAALLAAVTSIPR